MIDTYVFLEVFLYCRIQAALSLRVLHEKNSHAYTLSLTNICAIVNSQETLGFQLSWTQPAVWSESLLYLRSSLAKVSARPAKVSEKGYLFILRKTFCTNFSVIWRWIQNTCDGKAPLSQCLPLLVGKRHDVSESWAGSQRFSVPKSLHFSDKETEAEKFIERILSACSGENGILGDLGIFFNYEMRLLKHLCLGEIARETPESVGALSWAEHGSSQVYLLT